MAFQDWFKDDGAPRDLGPEDLRREQRRLGIREDQAVARLQSVVETRHRSFEQGAATQSIALRRILARKYASAQAEQRSLEREILRLGKDLVAVRALLGIADAGKKPPALGETAAELQVAYDDDKVGEASFRDALFAAMGLGTIDRDPVAEVFEAWRRLDQGELSDVREARIALERDAASDAKG